MRYRITEYLTLLFLLLFVCTASIAQTSKTNLKGSINKPQREFFLLKSLGRSDTVKLSTDGKFDVLIEQQTANYFTIEYNRQSITLYLLPADVIMLTSGGVNLLDANISGSSAAYCNFLIQRQNEDRAFLGAYPAYKLGSMPAEEYYAKRDSVLTVRMTMLEKASKEKDFITPFKTIEAKIYRYQMGLDLINYQKRVAEMGVTVMPKVITDYIQSIEVNDESMAYDAAYKSFTLTKASIEANAQYLIDTDKSAVHFYELAIKSLCSMLTYERNKSVLISELMPQILKDAGTADLSSFIQTLEQCSKDAKLIGSVKKYAAQFEHLYAGKPAPDAEFYDASGKTSKLSDYRGKAVYIDTWATWCGPCKREIPFLKTLEEEFHGKNITFISVSTDRDVEAWKNFITKESMGGMQLHQNENPQKSMNNLYVVNSIPRFILIDESGNIVSTDAPRPSSGDAIRGMINKVLND